MVNEYQQAQNIWNIYNQKQKKQLKLLMLMYYWLRLSKRTYKQLEEKKKDISRQAYYDKYDDYNEEYIDFKKKLLQEVKLSLYKDARSINEFIGNHLEEIYEDIFYQTALYLEKYDLTVPSKEEIYKITHATWVGNKNFEQRTYWNVNQIYNKYIEILDSGLSYDDAMLEFEKLKENYWYRIRRLVRTETMHVINASTMKVYRACGIELVQWKTCMDEKTCKICAGRDDTIYPLSLCPRYPDHPFCRCILVAVVSNIKNFKHLL